MLHEQAAGGNRWSETWERGVSQLNSTPAPCSMLLTFEKIIRHMHLPTIGTNYSTPEFDHIQLPKPIEANKSSHALITSFSTQ